MSATTNANDREAPEPGARENELRTAAIQRILDLLAIQRQELKYRNESAETIEANERAIVYWHRRLAEARQSKRPERPSV